MKETISQKAVIKEGDKYLILLRNREADNPFPGLWDFPGGRWDLDPGQLPDTISEVGDEMLNETIGCEHGGTCGHTCTIGLKITPEELSFYRSQGIPLPKLCFHCRHAARAALRNPLEIWRRGCMCVGTESRIKNNELRITEWYKNTAVHTHGDGPCQNQFETSYSPDRPEIVYCEACYNSEIA